MDTTTAPSEGTTPGEGLHKELSLVDAAAFSVGLIGPVGAIGLLGTGAALIIGRAVTLSFVFAVVGVALVAYCFVKLSQHISHTGSVYALAGVTLGPQAGFFAGWALMGAYIAIGCGSTIEIGLFAANFINGTFGAHITEWWWLAMIGLLGVAAVAFMEIRVITRALLTSEVIGAILVTILSVVILVKVIFSHGPGGQTFSLNFLALPHGSGISTIAKAAVYGFLAFAGFEGAAALGEETSSPKTEIPRAIKTAVVVVGAFYLLTAAAQSLGYGATAKGAEAYAAGLPFSDLGTG
jgi:amino acid transporter